MNEFINRIQYLFKLIEVVVGFVEGSESTACADDITQMSRPYYVRTAASLYFDISVNKRISLNKNQRSLISSIYSYKILYSTWKVLVNQLDYLNDCGMWIESTSMSHNLITNQLIKLNNHNSFKFDLRDIVDIEFKEIGLLSKFFKVFNDILLPSTISRAVD